MLTNNVFLENYPVYVLFSYLELSPEALGDVLFTFEVPSRKMNDVGPKLSEEGAFPFTCSFPFHSQPSASLLTPVY